MTTGTAKRSRTKRVTLKAVAEHVKLSPTTVSVVLNRSPVADSIPAETQARIFEAARELRYRPNYMARSLRSQRSFSVGVLVPEISEGYAAGVMSGIETHLLQEGYFYLVASHRSKAELLDEYLAMLADRGVEGFVLVAASLEKEPDLPTVVVSGHRRIEGVTNVVIDHDRAARLALEHLVELGHSRVAFLKGHEGNADTEDRWRANMATAEALGLETRPELCLQLSGHAYGENYTQEEGYQEGYVFGQQLVEHHRDFTALFAFNDISAIGAIRAFLDAGLRIPQDISVVGFDDIQSAAFQNPSLTTVRQPLREMGIIAGRILLERLGGDTSHGDFVTVDPQLIIRGSTCSPRARR